MRYCEHFRVFHPDYLDGILTADQLWDWVKYAERHGLGQQRDDVHWGLLIATVANQFRSEGRPIDPKDCMPYLKYDPLDEDITADELRAKLNINYLKAISALQRGEI